jgi:hypothetical protein
VRDRVRRAAVAFGRFWWNFLIGDTPELFIGTLFVVGAAGLLRHDRTAGLTVVVALVVVFLLVSTYRGRDKAVLSAPGDHGAPFVAIGGKVVPSETGGVDAAPFVARVVVDDEAGGS